MVGIAEVYITENKGNKGWVGISFKVPVVEKIAFDVALAKCGGDITNTLRAKMREFAAEGVPEEQPPRSITASEQVIIDYWRGVMRRQGVEVFAAATGIDIEVLREFVRGK